jgi:hypothetical protein
MKHALVFTLSSVLLLAILVFAGHRASVAISAPDHSCAVHARKHTATLASPAAASCVSMVKNFSAARNLSFSFSFQASAPVLSPCYALFAEKLRSLPNLPPPLPPPIV